MKYIKMLGLLAVAAAALMAFAGAASATTVTSGGSAYTGSIAANSTHSVLHGSFTSVTCKKSTVAGKVESHGAAVTAEGKISSLTFTECNYPVSVKKGGTLIAHATSGGNGTLTSSGAEIEVETSVGLCVFKTSATDIGTLTGSTSSHAVLDIASASIPQESNNFFCGSKGTWTGTYTVTTPSNLSLH